MSEQLTDGRTPTIRSIERELLVVVPRLNMRKTAEDYIRAGNLLIEAHKLVKHGQWESWCKAMGISPSSAKEYMQCARFFQVRPELLDGNKTIGLRKLQAFISEARFTINKDDRQKRIENAPPSGIKLYHADCRQFAWEGEYDLVVADPPWLDVSHYSWLDEFCQKHLKKGGLALIQAAQHNLPEVYASIKGLDYRWTMAIVYHWTKPRPKANFVKRWRPVLVYQHGGYLSATMTDMRIVTEPKENFKHKWQQPCSPWRYWLEIITYPGQRIADPFAGSSPLGIVAHELKLDYTGTEIDKESYDEALFQLGKLK